MTGAFITTIFVILIILAIAALFVMLAIALRLADGVRELLKQSGMDMVQLYLAAASARLDVAERESRLKVADELGQSLIRKQRFEPIETELRGVER